MAKKRGNNEGSIYKRNNGTWRAQITLQGQRLGYSAKSKGDAQSWLRKMLDEVEGGLQYEGTQIILVQFMNDWLTSIEPSLRYSTHQQYEQISQQHIFPALGRYKLRNLKPDHIQRLYNEMVKHGKGLRTVRLTHAVLRRSLVHAVKLGLLTRNPADATMPPKLRAKEMKFLDEASVQKFLASAQATNDRFYALYHLAISTGMRQGELLALNWNDLDDHQATLQVRRQLIRKRGGGFRFATPKTKAGIRSIDLGENTLNVLNGYREKRAQEALIAGSKWQEQNLIFPSTIGTPMNRDNLRKGFKRLLRQAELPDMRFHDLRHTAASLMLNNGIPVIVVSKRLGHAKPSITLDVYGHLIPSKQQQVTDLMEQLLTPVTVGISA